MKKKTQRCGKKNRPDLPHTNLLLFMPYMHVYKRVFILADLYVEKTTM
jgi:hypothetical protein